MKNIPNLFLIGAMKSGTTSLHHYLSFHPQLFMCEPKEPGFFREPATSKESESWYYSLFDRANSTHKYLGDGSTDYAKIPQYEGVPERIYKVSPDAKIIYLLRDPFKRLVSHYWHTVRPTPKGGQTKGIYEAVKSFEEYLAFSDYPRQIAPFFDTFGRDNVYIMIFEAFTASPQEELTQLFHWLGVDGEYEWSHLNDRLNERPSEIVKVGGAGILQRLSHTALWSSMSSFFPKTLKQKLKRLAQKPVDPSVQEQGIEKVRVEYKDFFNEVAEKTEKLSGNNQIKKLWSSF